MEMSSRIHDALTRYNEFRYPHRLALALSKVYALFPDEASAQQALLRWPQPWPNADSAGVYLIFGPQMEFLYLGKAGNLNGRVSSYFKYSADGLRRCEIRHAGWSMRPSFVSTIAVDDDMPFEAPALEEFLISQLQPPDNRRGIIK